MNFGCSFLLGFFFPSHVILPTVTSKVFWPTKILRWIFHITRIHPLQNQNKLKNQEGMWVTNQCCSPGLSEPHIDVSCIVMNQFCKFQKSIFPPASNPRYKYTSSRLLQEVLSKQVFTIHTKIKRHSDTNIVSELWGQTLASSILLLIRSDLTGMEVMEQFG